MTFDSGLHPRVECVVLSADALVRFAEVAAALVHGHPCLHASIAHGLAKLPSNTQSGNKPDL